jgi:hypothetical protein
MYIELLKIIYKIYYLKKKIEVDMCCCKNIKREYNRMEYGEEGLL